MNFTEEHVTRATARLLVTEGWEVIAVHPPDGQGPFVIPRPPESLAIERSSYHPDVVAIRANSKYGAELLIAECKLREADLRSDEEKLTELARSRESLAFALFRCQQYRGGPDIAVNLEAVLRLNTRDFPFQFILTASADLDSNPPQAPIEGFLCRRFLFGPDTLRA